MNLLPRPTIDLVNAECAEFDREESLVEESLCLLWAQFPKNSDIRHVLLKVLVLNKLYGTMIRDIDIETVAKHIVGLASDKHLDQLLDQGSLDAVFLITDCQGVKQYLSFASKFCSWHNPTAYPIYDGNVRECLWSYGKQDRFAEFRNEDLWYYRKLLEIIIAFRNCYGLSSLNFKQLDKFMYRSGGRILKDREDQKSQASAV